MNHRRVLLLTISAFIFLCTPFVAAQDGEPVDASRLTILSSVEIEELLSGNTAIGEWSGTLYRQVFRSNGATIYLPENTRDSLGEWRVDAVTNTYESRWEMGGWASYSIGRLGMRYFWIGSSLPPQEFAVLVGERLFR